jgi:hypothetical protein
MNNKTTFLRTNKNDNFTILSNSIIKSTDYTPQAKDILFYLLHLPDDWVIYKENVKKHYKKTIKGKKFDDSWGELKTKGHIQGIRIKLQNGKFSAWEYKIIEQPSTDIPNSDTSEIGVVDNTSTQNMGDIISTNLVSTNEQNTNSTNLYNTSKILEDENIQFKSKNVKKNWTELEIQRDINQSAFKSIFNNTGIDWENELESSSVDEFIQKYVYLDSNTGDDYRIRNFVENYFMLKNR